MVSAGKVGWERTSRASQVSKDLFLVLKGSLRRGAIQSAAMQVPTTEPLPRARKPRIVFASSDPATIIASNQTVASPFQIEKHKREAARNWDIFYKNHEKADENGQGFFKDRHWTTREWDVLTRIGGSEVGGKGKGKVVLEVGCGTGAFVYP